MKLLEVFLRYSMVSTGGDYVGRPSPMMSLESLQSLGLDPPALRSRVADMLPRLEGNSNVAAETFLSELDDLPGLSGVE